MGVQRRNRACDKNDGRSLKEGTVLIGKDLFVPFLSIPLIGKG